AVRALFDILQLLDAGDVDHKIGLYQAQVQKRPERLPACKQFDGRVVRARKADSRRNVGRTRIVKTDWLHGELRRARAIPVRIPRGVIGDTSISTPSGRKASLTALAMAAGGAIAPPSPIPLTPNSVCGAGVSM